MGGVVGFRRGRQLHSNFHGYELELPAVLAGRGGEAAPLGIICPVSIETFSPTSPPAASASNSLKANLSLLS